MTRAARRAKFDRRAMHRPSRRWRVRQVLTTSRAEALCLVVRPSMARVEAAGYEPNRCRQRGRYWCRAASSGLLPCEADLTTQLDQYSQGRASNRGLRYILEKRTSRSRESSGAGIGVNVQEVGTLASGSIVKNDGTARQLAATRGDRKTGEARECSRAGSGRPKGAEYLNCCSIEPSRIADGS